MTIKESLESINNEIGDKVVLVAVSKTHPTEVLMEAYDAGQRHFGENKVQELTAKAESLPTDIKWHMIGHLQSNKVKYIAPFIYLIHGVDSLKLLKTIDKEAKKVSRIVSVLLQIHIADEESKFGFSADELYEILESNQISALKNVKICGVMGMATNTDDEEKVKGEFANLSTIFKNLKEKFFSDNADFTVVSMGMSDDYNIAIAHGSNMIRVGSKIFGYRSYDKPL